MPDAELHAAAPRPSHGGQASGARGLPQCSKGRAPLSSAPATGATHAAREVARG
ncbi:hypothetical protein N177_1525 [Lutibaculum baratangense AMV1]|uniref:Uncharacterized protein n=1 Tax=Lutibaculum baratangense AMV1 TaxID=631454 RepID=V4R118_9HYPH|nr:hypothetical protein N177_1525 [Lutibaculum baratangense AMV1]